MFTVEESKALDALREAFGGTEIDVLDVAEMHADHYVKSARNYAMNAIHYSQLYQASTDPGLAEEKDKRYAEIKAVEDAKKIKRLAEAREHLVSGWLAGLLPKIQRRMPDSNTTFSLGEEAFEFFSEADRFDDYYEIDFTYYRADYSVVIRVNELSFQEDWSTLDGNTSPREQSNGYAAIVDFLDGLSDD